MVLSKFRGPINRVSSAVASVFEWVGLSPNGVSVLALLVTIAGAVLIGYHYLIWGAIVAGIGGVMDLLDGALARRTGTVSPFGGYLDSLLDRFADGVLFLAVGWHYDEWWIWIAAFSAFITAVGTSYARARVYEEVTPPRDAWPDLVERGERVLVLLVGVGVQGIVNAVGGGVRFLPWLVVGLAVLGGVTVVQRATRSKRFLQEAEDA